jgi:hypothetical protein
MFQTSASRWPFLLACAAAAVTATAQSSTDKWWTGYGGGPDKMYEMAGRQYVLLPAAGTPPRTTSAGVTGPLGWVAYALPLKH